MHLTDQEIREILVQERKRKRKRRRIKRRIISCLILIGVVFLAVGIFSNRNALAQPKGIIFIDPGHGGADPGSYVGDKDSPDARFEANDTLRLSQKVKTDLEDMGYKVYMSRDSDKDVAREERGAIANSCKAQLMISIHRNKATEGNGVEVFIPSSNSKEAQLLGNNVMKALVRQGFQERQVRAGTLVTDQDDYYENSIPTMPSCLVEVGFMQDSHDNALFDDNIDENAQAIADALNSTFEKLYVTEDD